MVKLKSNPDLCTFMLCPFFLFYPAALGMQGESPVEVVLGGRHTPATP